MRRALEPALRRLNKPASECGPRCNEHEPLEAVTILQRAVDEIKAAFHNAVLALQQEFADALIIEFKGVDLIVKSVSEVPKREIGRPKSKPDHDDLARIRDLMTTHWREAQDAHDVGKFDIGFRVTFDRGSSPTKFKLTYWISKAFSDEIESVVEDPRQGTLL